MIDQRLAAKLAIMDSESPVTGALRAPLCLNDPGARRVRYGGNKYSTGYGETANKPPGY